MVAAFPVAKLGFLFVKQISKPVAKQIAARAKSSRLFRDYVCIPVAQLFHWYEVKLKVQMMNVGGKVTKVPKLNEAKAIEQGSEILSEFILLSIASTILIYEYNRSKEKEDKKEEDLALERERLRNKIFEIEFKVEKQTTQIRELARTVIHIEEDIHKRSVRRIFEKKPKVSPEILESAQDAPSSQLFLVQPLEVLEPPAPSVEPSEIEAPTTTLTQPAKEETPTVNLPVREEKKSLILSAANDILNRK